MNDLTTNKIEASLLVEVLKAKGIRKAVLSPGSRNAPLLIAFAREPGMEHFVVLDERSAAFFALGLAQQSGEAVALACTSGTAMLNYAPAVAEAFYQRLPLVVVSADRPVEWIDQDDSQTIRQNGVLRNIVKGCYQLMADVREEEERWYVNRVVNDAVNCALGGRRGPVHINVPLHEPLYGLCKREAQDCRVIERVDITRMPDEGLFRSWAEKLNGCRKVMILAGCHVPDEGLKRALDRLAGLPNVVVLTETPANLGSQRHIGTIDRVLAVIEESEKSYFTPDLLISYGGPLISKHIKVFLRNYRPLWHWRVERGEDAVDTFRVLSSQIDMDAEVFFPLLARFACPRHSEYALQWKLKQEVARERHKAFAAIAPWSDWKAFQLILPALPAGCALQLANSTPVRYAQLFEYFHLGRVDGNRGTSGIDGSTSTAVGAAYLYPGVTVLITGDMSFLYDSNALWNKYITARLKIIVMKNGGGGIFRFLPGSSEVEELEECFETEQEVNVQGFACLHGFQYLYAGCEDELRSVLPEFYCITDRPSILEVETPRHENAEVLKEYFRKMSGV